MVPAKECKLFYDKFFKKLNKKDKAAENDKGINDYYL